MVLDQVGILVTGVIAVWLTQHKRESWRRWACIFGLLAQPFWFYAAWKAEQWGILAISTLYTYAWARGIWTYWLASERTGSAPNQGNSNQPGVAVVAKVGRRDRCACVGPPPLSCRHFGALARGP
jgi:hypothetical protein